MNAATDRIDVLHVTDDPDFAEQVAEYLEQEEERITVQTAATAADGSEMLAERDVDCIVSDYELPGKSGVELLEQVREAHPDLPFILFTGTGSETVASEAISAGVTDYLRKEAGVEQYTTLANRIVDAVSQFRRETGVERTREFFETILDQASDYVIILDDGALVEYVSPAVERVLGYPPAAIEGNEIFELIHPDDVDDARTAFVEISENPDRERTLEVRARHDDGSWRWLEVRGRHLLEEHGISGVIVNVRDISERRAAEKALDTEQEFIEQALNALHDLFFVLSPEGKIERANERALEVTGYSEDEIRSMDPTEFFVQEDQGRIAESISEIFETGDTLVEATLLTKDNERRHYEFRGKRLGDDDGDVTGIVGIGRDITGRSLYEDRLKVSQRVLRHNLRNELNVVRGWVETIEETASEPQQEMVDRVLPTIDRLVKLSEKTRQMAELDYDAEKSSPTVDVVTRVPEIIEEFRRQYPEATIELEVQSADELLLLSIDGRFDTALRNAIENAIVHNPTNDPWVRVVVEQRDQEVRIRIADNGPGIPEMEQEVLGTGEETPLLHGSGLGLWLIYWCVATGGGDVTFEERDPTGSRIDLCFPLANK